ncbi:hypothetical protein [Tuwongella immobilis]|uniref:hypothetical protein n=1 Tax=Tuwongella immobilis TaxID=692036 RepID=UPI0013A6AB73|nr:hypothetical protein [Tuwongella immobilis]
MLNLIMYFLIALLIVTVLALPYVTVSIIQKRIHNWWLLFLISMPCITLLSYILTGIMGCAIELYRIYVLNQTDIPNGWTIEEYLSFSTTVAAGYGVLFTWVTSGFWLIGFFGWKLFLRIRKALK